MRQRGGIPSLSTTTTTTTTTTHTHTHTTTTTTTATSTPFFAVQIRPEVRNAVSAEGVPADEILGIRAPQLQPGGLNEFTALAQEKFLYDASCSTSSFVEEGTLLWPYTYDYAPGPTCDNGESPEQEFPGMLCCLLYTSPSPRDISGSRMPSSA